MTQTDGDGHTTSDAYDGSGRGVLVDTNDAGDDDLESLDTLGQEAASRNPHGFWTVYGLDALGDATTTTDPLGNLTLALAGAMLSGPFRGKTAGRDSPAPKACVPCGNKA